MNSEIFKIHWHPSHIMISIYKSILITTWAVQRPMPLVLIPPPSPVPARIISWYAYILFSSLRLFWRTLKSPVHMHLDDSHSAVDNQFSTVFLEVKCDSNMVGYHYIYDILGANYGTLSLIIIPLLSINIHASDTSPAYQHAPTLLKVVWCHMMGGI